MWQSSSLCDILKCPLLFTFSYEYFLFKQMYFKFLPQNKSSHFTLKQKKMTNGISHTLLFSDLEIRQDDKFFFN
jgi:hypothetical protein